MAFRWCMYTSKYEMSHSNEETSPQFCEGNPESQSVQKLFAFSHQGQHLQGQLIDWFIFFWDFRCEEASTEYLIVLGMKILLGIFTSTAISPWLVTTWYGIQTKKTWCNFWFLNLLLSLLSHYFDEYTVRSIHIWTKSIILAVYHSIVELKVST